MELCYNRKKDIWVNRVGIIVFSLVALVAILSAILVWRNLICIHQNKIDILWPEMILFLSTAIVAMIWAISSYCLYSREYSVDSKGIKIKILKKHILQYSWDDVSEISICDINLATKSLAYDMAIRIVIGDEKNGPSNPRCTRSVINGIEHWRDQSYEIKHLRQVISVIYSDDRFREIKLLSGKEIKDYRTRRGKAQKIEIG